MKWKDKPEIEYVRDGYVALVYRKFLFWPLKISGETRWLEFASYNTQFKYNFIFMTEPFRKKYGRWKPISWVDHDE